MSLGGTFIGIKSRNERSVTKSVKENSEITLTPRPMRFPRANHLSSDLRIQLLANSCGTTHDRYSWSRLDVRAVLAKAARRILAPSQHSNLGNLVLYQLDCL